MEGVDAALRVLEISDWLPGVVALVIPFPSDLVLKPPPSDLAVEYFVYFVLRLVFVTISPYSTWD